MARWAILLAGVLSGCQCGKTQLDPIDTSLTIDEALRFPDTYLGYPTTRAFTVQNRSRAPVHLALAVDDGPFALMSPEVEVPAGASTTVSVIFSPVAEGVFTGRVTLTAGNVQKQVALGGSGVRPAACAASNPCRVSRFNPDAGACAEADVADGTACAGNSCNLDTRCVSGVCVGRGRDCSDGDACTVDACDVVAGCLHRARTCPAPENPCKVARCDADAGCASDDAPDGTRCGDTDCVTAHVCLSGSCRQVAAPDGLECTPASACRGAGVCTGQVCVTPPVAPLPRRWTYRPDAGELDYDVGLQMDALGNAYTRECVPGCRNVANQTWLISVSPQGALRYRVPLPSGPWLYAYNRRTQLVADGLVISTAGTLDITAVDTTTGQVRWAVDLGQVVTPPIKQSAVLALASPAPGRLTVAMSIDSVGGAFWGDWLAELSTVNGAVLWSRQRHSYAELIADEQGTLYIGQYVTSGEVVALDAHGNDVFTLPGAPDESSAVYKGRFATGWGFQDFDGGVTSWDSLGVPGLASGGGISFGASLLDDSSMYGYRVLQQGSTATSVAFSIDQLLAPSRSWVWSAQGYRWPRTSALLATGELFEVAATASDYGVLTLRRGVVTMDCPLGFNNALDAVIDQGMLVVMDVDTMAGYALPGLSLAASGWVSNRGDVTRAGRPR